MAHHATHDAQIKALEGRLNLLGDKLASLIGPSQQVGELIPICRYLVSPGGASESVQLYCGRVDSRGLGGGIHGLADEHEDIRVEVQSVDDALAALAAGKIGNAVTIIALQWLALNRDRLRAAWC